MRRRVFVSYKRKSDLAPGQDSEQLADGMVARLSAAGYEVFLDKTIVPGVEWHRAIDRGLGLAHAAVVLLSPAALASQWVQYELSVLCFRARLPGVTFPRLIIALVGGVPPSALQQAPFPSMNASAFEVMVPKGTDATLAAAVNEFTGEAKLFDKVLAALARTVPARGGTAADRLVERVAEILGDFESLLDDLEQDLEMAPVPDEMRRSRVAEVLLTLKLGAFYALADRLKQGRRSTRAGAQELLELVFPYWVNAQAAAQLVLAAEAGRIPVLQAERMWTVEQYLRRAEENPAAFWRAVDARLPTGERDEEAVVMQFAREAAARHVYVLEEDGSDLFEEVKGARGKLVFFPVVADSAGADVLLRRGEGEKWIRPVLLAPAAPPAYDKAVALNPALETERERTAHKIYERLPKRLSD